MSLKSPQLNSQTGSGIAILPPLKLRLRISTSWTVRYTVGLPVFVWFNCVWLICLFFFSVFPALMRLLAGGVYTMVFQLGYLFFPDSLLYSLSFDVSLAALFTQFHFKSACSFTSQKCITSYYLSDESDSLRQQWDGNHCHLLGVCQKLTHGWDRLLMKWSCVEN
jgi:hypothetical protein